MGDPTLEELVLRERVHAREAEERARLSARSAKRPARRIRDFVFLVVLAVVWYLVWP